MMYNDLLNQKVIAKDPLGNLNKGEYTGKNRDTGKHCVSFYNGFTREYGSINEIIFC